MLQDGQRLASISSLGRQFGLQYSRRLSSIPFFVRDLAGDPSHGLFFPSRSSAVTGVVSLSVFRAPITLAGRERRAEINAVCFIFLSSLPV